MEKIHETEKKEKMKVIGHHVAFKTLKLAVQDKITDNDGEYDDHSDGSDSDGQEDSDDDGDVVDFTGDDNYNSAVKLMGHQIVI